MTGAHGSRHSRDGWDASWQTDAVPRDEQFLYWREVVCQAFLPLAPERSGTGPFSGFVGARSLGPLTVALVGSQAQSVHRSPQLVEREAGDRIYLNLQVSGEGETTQDGRRVRLRPGDMATVDGTRPFELNFDADFEQLSVGFPLELLGPRLAVPRAASAVRVAGDSGLGALIAGQLGLLARSAVRLDDPAARMLAEHLAALLALALGRASTPPRSARRALLLQAALDEIERRLPDPTLTQTSLALHLHISTRHLQRLFADQGTTVGRHLLSRRLESAHRDLSTPALSHLTIAEIATRNGFSDRSHFTRAFRARYRMSPRERRQRPE
jgi:AraC-like DNA-binding protein